jgi:hypothetical protein
MTKYKNLNYHSIIQYVMPIQNWNKNRLKIKNHRIEKRKRAELKVRLDSWKGQDNSRTKIRFIFVLKMLSEMSNSFLTLKVAKLKLKCHTLFETVK